MPSVDQLLNLLEGMDKTIPSNITDHSKVLIIDGHNLFYRNYSVTTYLNSEGIHVGGLVGFLRSLKTLINLHDPTALYILFDGDDSYESKQSTFQEYKQNRNNHIVNKKLHQDVNSDEESRHLQMENLIHYLKCLPLKIFYNDNEEADDVISYLAESLINQFNSEVTIVSSDKDFLQLLKNPKIKIYRPMEKVLYNEEIFRNKYGMCPHNYIFYKMLLGDKSDNIPGIKGLGPKKIESTFDILYKNPITLLNLIEFLEENKYKFIVNKWGKDFYNTDWKSQLTIYYDLINLNNSTSFDTMMEVDKLIPLRTFEFKPDLFIEYYKSDGLHNLIRDVDLWLLSTFSKLNKVNMHG